MHDQAIKFVVFDWYWTAERVRNEHALAAYFQAKNNELIQFSILWANHEAAPKTEDDFISMVRYWTRYYFRHKQYQRIDDRPVVHIFSPANLDQKAKLFGSTAGELIGRANAVAQEHGFPGIYFVGELPLRHLRSASHRRTSIKR